ncbi:YunC family protein [uncultured Methanofollis sp.]|uniref:YunC family protein n=1 Tax=uncultured Methanofollis sp. TaxID=262500 RepID=UPI0026097638|nr:YunC family protein [uncultured Methanofollis sp.]
MESTSLTINGKKAEGFVVPLGPVNLVFVKTEKGLVGCGVVDVQALEKFGYPAAKVRPSAGPSIRTVDDILTGTIAVANGPARALGIAEGMKGREALEHL